MLNSGIWARGYVRRCNLAGLSCVIASKGASEAGAIYICITMTGQKGRVLCPAPGPAYDENGERNWSCPLGPEPVPLTEIEDYLARQKRFDPDIWIIDVDDKTGEALIEPSSIVQS
ncbi:MAG TPA: DUF1491 family protein [Rhizobiales bacterium]|nr:DUF1491 family protein [Hyphomicrobiales bacterium]